MLARWYLGVVVVGAAACSGPSPAPAHTYLCGDVSCTQDQACVADAHADGGSAYSCAPDHGCATSLAVYCGGSRSAVCSSTPAYWTDVDAGDVDFGLAGPPIDDGGVYGGLASFVTCQVTGG